LKWIAAEQPGVNEFTFAGRARWYASGNICELIFLAPTQHMEAGMLGDGDDAGHCSNGLSAKNYRIADPEDRATFRAWLRGVAVFYLTVLMLSGAIAILSYKDVGLTQLASLYAHVTANVTAGPPSNGNGVVRPPAKTAGSAWW
jgi:hypothetical protein